jgi:serine protease Do
MANIISKKFNHSFLMKLVIGTMMLCPYSDQGLAANPFSMVLRGKSTPASFADIVEPLLPAVVNISTTSEIVQERRTPGLPGSPLEDFFRHFFEEGLGGRLLPPRKASTLGSGFIVAQKGKEAFIVTCNHVIADAEEIKVFLHNDDTELKAEVVGRDRRTDLALLKIKTDKKLTVAEWGDSSKLRVGDWVIAIGNPFGLSSTVTTGIVSTLARDISERSSDIVADYINNYIQTDASINMGNSGGPMFNVEGKVVAISTAIFSPNGGNIGIGFGIPSDLAKHVIDQLMSMGRTQRGWLGVKVQPVTEEVAEALGLQKPMGALVGEVSPKSPAEKVGMKSGDVILKFNGIDVKDSRYLPRIVGETPIGKDVPIVIWRDNKEQTLHIRVGEFETAEAEGLIRPYEEEREVIHKKNKTLGLVLQEITPGARERFRIPDEVQGILIAYVDPQSEAAEKGLRPGDVIVEAVVKDKRMKMSQTSDFQKFVEEARKDKKTQVLLLVSRRGSLRFINLRLEEAKKLSGRGE